MNRQQGVRKSVARWWQRVNSVVPSTVPRGVMVAQMILDHFVKVRVLARQPIGIARPILAWSMYMQSRSCKSFKRRMKRHSLPVVLAICLATLPPASRGDDDWQLIKVDNRDYLSLDNIAQFYALQAHPRLADNRLVMGDSRVRLEVCNNPREVYVNGVKQWLSFPVRNQNGQVLVSRFDLAKTVEPCLRPTMVTNLRPFRTVVLDAGHGGQDGGGHSATGWEKEYALDTVRDLKKSLESKGLNVVLTRDTDTYLSLESRAERANEIPDSILVSLHFNSGDASAVGFEVYAMTPRGASSTADARVSLEQFQQMPGNEFDDASLALGTCVHHSLLGHIPQTDRGVKRARFAVLRLTHSPAILVEGGFLTSPSDSQHINDATWRQKLADAIAAGVQSYQNLAELRQSPKLICDYRNEQLALFGLGNRQTMLAAGPGLAPADALPVSSPEP